MWVSIKTIIFQEFNKLLMDVAESIPHLIAALLILLMMLGLTRLLLIGVKLASQKLIRGTLVRGVVFNLARVLLWSISIYVSLRASGLTQLAATVIGGTGLIGIVVGFAFRDIAENFLASVLLSVNRPFRLGDVVEIEGDRGVVEKMTTRCTILMNFDGDHIQIPNIKIFNSRIRNLTANPNQRSMFSVGVGYDCALSSVQTIILEELRNHPAVLSEPRPLVLVHELGASTVEVRGFFWINILEHDPFKAKSSIIRLTKAALQSHNIPMPDEAREIIFPQGVPVLNLNEINENKQTETVKSGRTEHKVSESEESLSSERNDIREQLRQFSSPEKGTNILAEDI